MYVDNRTGDKTQLYEKYNNQKQYCDETKCTIQYMLFHFIVLQTIPQTQILSNDLTCYFSYFCVSYVYDRRICGLALVLVILYNN